MDNMKYLCDWDYFSTWRLPTLCQEMRCILDMSNADDLNGLYSHMRWEFINFKSLYNGRMYVERFDPDERDWKGFYYTMEDIICDDINRKNRMIDLNM